MGGAAPITRRARSAPDRDQHRRALRRRPGPRASTSRPDFTEPTMHERCAQRIEVKRRTHRGSTAPTTSSWRTAEHRPPRAASQPPQRRRHERGAAARATHRHHRDQRHGAQPRRGANRPHRTREPRTTSVSEEDRRDEQAGEGRLSGLLLWPSVPVGVVAPHIRPARSNPATGSALGAVAQAQPPRRSSAVVQSSNSDRVELLRATTGRD